MKLFTHWLLPLSSAGLMMAACTASPTTDFGTDNNYFPHEEEEVPTPPPQTNMIMGSLGDRPFGEIESAFLVKLTLSCGSRVYMMWLSDYPFVCSEIVNSLSGVPLQTDDYTTVVGIWVTSLYAYDTSAQTLEGTASVGDYSVMTLDDATGPFENGDQVAFPAVTFINGLGTVAESYEADSGELIVEYEDRPDYFAGTFNMSFGTVGWLEGEFNLRECH